MVNMKRLIAMGLCVSMVGGLTACGGSSDGSAQTSNNNAADNSNADASASNADTSASGSGSDASADSSASASGGALYNEGERRTIKIGTWYDHFYDSTHTDIHDNPNVSDEEMAQMQFDIVKEVEEKYNVSIEFVNLTFNGCKESVNTSVLAGTPDCDIYETDLQWGIAAALNGFATNLEDILPADADIFNDPMVFAPVDIGTDSGVYLFKSNSGESLLADTYMLAYNKQMLDEAGLEDPNVLYEKGEWTWDKWREYMLALTQDTDGDGVTDVYGYGGVWTQLLSNLLMSNGTGIAMGPKENLSSPEVAEVIDYMYNMYNVDHVANPWNEDDWDYNQNSYMDGRVAFWITAAWISDANKDSELSFDIGWCPWPIGPSGSEETNKFKSVSSGNAWMIPAGVKDPELVYNVFYDWQNWYHSDESVRDSDLTWWEDCAITEENYAVMEYMGARGGFDLWGALGLEWDWVALLKGEMTAAQLQESYKQTVQDALDGFFGG